MMKYMMTVLIMVLETQSAIKKLLLVDGHKRRRIDSMRLSRFMARIGKACRSM